jgi:hypothetical protein
MDAPRSATKLYTCTPGDLVGAPSSSNVSAAPPVGQFAVVELPILWRAVSINVIIGRSTTVW